MFCIISLLLSYLLVIINKFDYGGSNCMWNIQCSLSVVPLNSYLCQSCTVLWAKDSLTTAKSTGVSHIFIFPLAPRPTQLGAPWLQAPSSASLQATSSLIPTTCRDSLPVRSSLPQQQARTKRCTVNRRDLLGLLCMWSWLLWPAFFS